MLPPHNTVHIANVIVYVVTIAPTTALLVGVFGRSIVKPIRQFMAKVESIDLETAKLPIALASINRHFEAVDKHLNAIDQYNAVNDVRMKNLEESRDSHTATG
jgi:hypothetical protein